MQTNEDNFLITKEYKRFTEFCEACKRDKYIGLCYGVPGVGKTLSARHYSHWSTVEKFGDTLNMNYPPIQISTQVQEYNAAFYTAEVINTPNRILVGLSTSIMYLENARQESRFYQILSHKEHIDEQEYWAMRNSDMSRRSREKHSSGYVAAELLIIDESDRLKVLGLEQIREFHDTTGCGIILVGMPGMEKKLSRYAQLYSRIGFVHEFRPLSKEEMVFIMCTQLQKVGLQYNADDFIDHETLTAIMQISRGNFRLLNRLFKQIIRIMEINQVKTITAEIVHGARQCLVIGN